MGNQTNHSKSKQPALPCLLVIVTFSPLFLLAPENSIEPNKRSKRLNFITTVVAKKNNFHTHKIKNTCIHIFLQAISVEKHSSFVYMVHYYTATTLKVNKYYSVHKNICLKALNALLIPYINTENWHVVHFSD